MVINPYIFGGTDSDAQAFITAAGITDTTQKSAINQLVLDLKAAGIWTKMKALYPFVGGTATSHKFNLKDPRDLDVAFRLSFVGGGTHSATGYQPNGTTAYADTFLAPQSAVSQNSMHFSYYSRTNSNTGLDMGARYPNANAAMAYLVIRSGGSSFHRFNEIGVEGSVVNSNGTGLYTLSRISSANYGSFKNTTKTTINQSSQSIPTQSVTIGGYYENLWYYGNKESAFASIGDGLTDSEVTALYNAVQTFQTTLGRQIVSDSDAQAFIDATSITDNTQKNAINQLVLDLKTANIWSKMKAIYPFVGGTASQHRFNLKDPRPLAGAFYLDFAGGVTHSSNGVQFDGATGYADTKLIPSSNLSLNSTHISFYSRTNNLANTAKSEIGVTSSATYLPLLHLRIKGLESGFSDQAVSQIWSYETNQGIRVGVSYDSTGLFVSSRSSNSSFKLTRNNSLVGQVTTVNNQTTMPNAKVYLGALNDSDTNTYYFTDRESAFASIGDGLSDSEVTSLYNAVQNFQTTLGRQV